MEVQVIKKKEEQLDETTGLKLQKMRVAAYARVSTDSEEQQTSFKSQQSYYMDKIYSNPNWIFVEVYADEGISGTQANKRENFMRMIKDAEIGKFDLLLTKSISRFARNTLDTLRYVRMLKQLNIAVYFEEEGINTLDMSGELLLTVLSSVAQQESETISSHVKLGFKMKMQRGELVGYNNCYGYSYDSKHNSLSIIESEAEVVRMIFNWYVNGYGCSSIAKMLTNMKILSPSGKDKWCENSISNILKNEKYIGDVEQGKTFIEDPMTHRQVINRGQQDKYYIKDHHEAIIEREIFDKARDIKLSRNNSRLTGRKMSKKFTFSGRFRCGFCGKAYVKKSLYRKREAWDCFTVQSQGRFFCEESKLFHQDTIESCFMEAYYLMTSDSGLVIDNFLDKLSKVNKKDTYSNMLKKANSERRTLTEKYNKLLDLYVEGSIEEVAFNRKKEEIENKVDECNQKIQQLSELKKEDNKVEIGLDRIKKELMNRELDTSVKEFDYNLFEALVDYGIIGGYNEKEEPEPYMIRFICKNGFNLRPREDISSENIIKNNSLAKKDSIYEPILDFISNQHFFVYKKINGRNQKCLITKVRVRVEIEKTLI